MYSPLTFCVQRNSLTFIIPQSNVCFNRNSEYMFEKFFSGPFLALCSLPATVCHVKITICSVFFCKDARERVTAAVQKEELRQKADHWKQRLRTFLRWVLLSTFIGIAIGGGVGTLFYYALKWSTQTRINNPWLLYLLPAGGLLIVWLYQLCGVQKSRGTDLVLLSIRSSQPLPARMAPLIFISTAITHLFGGSAGREGAALQIGGSLGYGAGRLFKLDEKSLHVMTMCGMGAVFSALFGMPVVASVFALEVISVGQMLYSALVPVAISCLLAAGISGWMGAIPTHFTLVAVKGGIQLVPALQVALLSAMCAIIAVLFCRCLQASGRLYRRFLPNPYLRILVGSALVICLTLLLQIGRASCRERV